MWGAGLTRSILIVMKPLAYHLLRQLANGDFHSGESLALATGMSRASVWNAVQEIQTAGIDVLSVRGRGYRLTCGASSP